MPTTPIEVESRAEFDRHLAAGSLAGLTMQGLLLDESPPDLTRIILRDTLFIGCRFASADVVADLVRRGAHVVPRFARPYPSHPARLYTPDDLATGFAAGGFAGMYDTEVFAHFTAHGGALPDIREALAQRLHDHGVDNALADTVAEWAGAGGGPLVGVMGGHAEPRGSAGYRTAAVIGRELAGAGCLVVTGGGPGVMEAANLGAFLADAPDDELDPAIDALAVCPDFHDHDPYTAAALKLRARFPEPPRHGGADVSTWARRGGLSVPTWLYGHEPANLFAARIAKYFSNAIREDTILRLARGGIVFAAGRAGTVQEVFQAATKAFYASDGPSGPFVFIGADYWTRVLPVESLLRPLLAGSPHGDQSHLVRVTDDPAEAVRIILDHPPAPPAPVAELAVP